MGRRISKKCLWCGEYFKVTEGTTDENRELCSSCARFPNNEEAMKYYRFWKKTLGSA